VDIFNDELYMTAGEQALLVLACGVDEPPPARVEDFASWLIAPISDALPALRHGARMALAECFAAAFACVREEPKAGRVWCVTRHPGALAWLHGEGVRPHRVVAHLALESVLPGDTVVGVLPLALAADLSNHGVRCLHIELPMQAADRGQELDAATMRRRGAKLVDVVVQRRLAG